MRKIHAIFSMLALMMIVAACGNDQTLSSGHTKTSVATPTRTSKITPNPTSTQKKFVRI